MFRRECDLSLGGSSVVRFHLAYSYFQKTVWIKFVFFLSIYTEQPVIVFKPTVTDNHVVNLGYRGYNDPGGGRSDTINESRETKFFNFLSTEIVDRARTYTFSNWPSITPSAQEMTLAGWWYTNIADRVICIHCDTMFHNWNETDRPYEIHRLKSPRCFYVRMIEEKGTVNNNQRQVSASNPSIVEVPHGQTIVGAVHAEYSLVFRRRQTFENWPEAEQSSLPSIDSFVEAGFFYTSKYHRNKNKIHSIFLLQ
jgi:hypothetical protein